MLSDILIDLNGIVDFISLQWQHVLSFLNTVISVPDQLEQFVSYLPSFALPFFSAGIGILIVRRIVGR